MSDINVHFSLSSTLQSSSPYFEENMFEMRKSKSSGLLFGHSRDFKNVETFNLSPGYRLSRSAGKIFVSIRTSDPPPPPKPAPKKLSYAEMEALLNDLREQVTLLSTYLEEERLRHAGTKKRAALDLVVQERRLREGFDKEIFNLKASHEDIKRSIDANHAVKMKKLEREWEEKMEEMQTEYRMLQASFKIYQSTLQDEMQDEMKMRRSELEWERKQAIERAVDDCKRKMEDIYSREREDLRVEFRKNMNAMMKEHQLEIEKISEKSKFDKNLAELMKRSEKLTSAEEEIERLKSDLKTSEINRRQMATELDETKRKLKNLEEQFDSKVRNVDDQHRSFIDSLKQQKADVTRRLVRSCEELQVERIARENAEKYRQEAAIISLEKKLLALNTGQFQADYTSGTDVKSASKGQDTKQQLDARLAQIGKLREHNSEVAHLQDVSHEQSDRVSHLIGDITSILSGVSSGQFSKVLSGMLVNLTESETKRRMSLNLHSSMNMSGIMDKQIVKKSASQLSDTKSVMDESGIVDKKSASQISDQAVAVGKRKQPKRGSKSRFSQEHFVGEAAGHKEYSDSTKSMRSTTESRAPYSSLTDTQQQFGEAIKSYSGLALAGSVADQQKQATAAGADQNISTSGSSYSRVPYFSEDEYNDYARSPEAPFLADAENKAREMETQTPTSYKQVGFSSDDSFNRKPKLHGFTKASTQPAIQLVQPADSKTTDLGTGRWRGTFLGRDGHGRPPIIFEVEEYKALTTTRPDSSKIAKKFPVHSSKSSAENVSRSNTPSPFSNLSTSPRTKP